MLPRTLIVGVSLLLFASCTEDLASEQTRYLEAAVEVGDWMIAQADNRGRIPDQALPDTTYSAFLGSGASGRAGTIRPGLYNGLSGVVYTLGEIEKVTGLHGYDRMLSELVKLVQGTEAVSPINDVIVGASGVGLTLLHLSETEKNDDLIEYASVIGDSILHRGIPSGEGLYWKRAEDSDFNLPNFSHGTAGTGYFLARLYEETLNEAYMEGAERAATYLMEIADQTDGGFLIPYGVPNDGFSTVYDIGWGHGPPGSVRLFYTLWKLSGNQAHRSVVEASIQSLVSSGLPTATRDSSKWTGPFRIDQRFGTAGALSLLLKLHPEFTNPAFRGLASEITEDILLKSQTAESGRFWSLPRYGFQGEPGQVAAYTGYFYGAAGLGFALIQMHYELVDKQPLVAFPDDRVYNN